MNTSEERLRIGSQRYGLTPQERAVAENAAASNLVRVCCQCGKNMGEKPPLEDKSKTHGYCDQCLAAMGVPTNG